MPSLSSNHFLKVRGGLIVSCQAPADSPLHNPTVIAAIAEAAIKQGAVGVRIDTPQHIQAVRCRVSAPIIGLWKETVPNSEVYITPEFRHAQAIAEAGADLIAVDGTLRPRPNGEALAELITKIHTQLNKPVMADVDSLEAAIAAATAGADWIATTLYGYTGQTKHLEPPGLDLLLEIISQVKLPILCEGGINHPSIAQTAIKLGAFAVVVGTDITGIDLKTQAYSQALSNLS